MKYYIIAGEPSGDLHGSKLIKEILSLKNLRKSGELMSIVEQDTQFSLIITMMVF